MFENLPSLPQTVRDYGLRADKSLGQHFLLDMNITDKIARLALPLDGVSVAEIGPGPGGLTRSVFKAGADRVLAIDMDERFLPVLEDIKTATGGRLDILHADALKVRIDAHLSGPIKIIANLPYNVGTKMLINWLSSDPLFWEAAVLMFQKEVAERVTAAPGESAYGRLAVLSQSVCDCRLAFEVPAAAFSPPPKVDSAVVVLEPKAPEDRFENLVRLGEITQAAFGQRRKMLRRSLKAPAAKYGLILEDWLGACGIDPTRRPETVSVTGFQALARLTLKA